MLTTKSVPLVRYFSLVSSLKKDSDEYEPLSSWGGNKRVGWSDLDSEFRSVILAEAGAGKSYEMEARAKYLQSQSQPAFFIRIEDIEAGFESAFEVGCAESFEKWIGSQGEAWFFLDSIDEARLDNPRKFERAILQFSKRIKNAQHRAHVFISSRPYAWRASSDRKIVEQYLPFAKPTKNNGEDTDANEESALKVYFLQPLSEADIKVYAESRDAENVEKFISDLQRTNLMSLAGRPFDLEGMLKKWLKDKKIDGRLELLRYNIDLQLNEIDPTRSERQPLNREKAKSGARLLAAAVLLTGEPGIRVPDADMAQKGIDAETILGDWEPREVRALLERGLFNDALYGLVRFRHRSVRELLAAEWFKGLLEDGASRKAVELLFIRKQYGVEILTPRLRTVLPWLLLFDNEIRNRAIRIAPEVTVEGGDAAHLPCFERKELLNNIVHRIANQKDDRSARDNSAIARIAQADLESDVLHLISIYNNNEDALFFLGRLAWQGEMNGCIPALSEVATNPDRGLYSRIVACRAVMECGNSKQKEDLWSGLLASKERLSHRLVAEMVDGTNPDSISISIVFATLDKLEKWKRYEATGLDQALHNFIDRFLVDSETKETDPIGIFINEINDFVGRKPYIERGDCPLSEEFGWLLGAAVHAVERVVESRSNVAFEAATLSILYKAPLARYWRGESFREYKDHLAELVPAWHELNDELFWRAIEIERDKLLERKNERLIDDWRIQWPAPFWGFHQERFNDVVLFIHNKPFVDDRLVALSIGFRLYEASGYEEKDLADLKLAVEGNEELEKKLELFLNPVPSSGLVEVLEEESRWKKQRDEEELQRNKDRSKWIKRLRKTPHVITSPPGVKDGELTYDQLWLMDEVEKIAGAEGKRAKAAEWRLLSRDFGEDVALAYREAAVAHWRKVMPALRSEGGDTLSIPYSLIFAMVGLEIENNENNSFPSSLSKSDIQHALRFLVWELNGFPSWVEKIYSIHPQLVVEAVIAELDWELLHVYPDKQQHYILHDLLHYAPWLHDSLAEYIIGWMEMNEVSNIEVARQCMQIVLNGNPDKSRVALLAKSKIAKCLSDISLFPFWYAIWVGADADEAVPNLKKWLASKDYQSASKAAQNFIVMLVGRRWGKSIEGGFRSYYTTYHLKNIYLLMHRYISKNDDIDRVGKGVYSPELRDDAQDARDSLFNLLSEIPGKETYLALLDLAKSHPDIDSRNWMAMRAYRRAELDGDLELWTERQVREFAQYQVRTPVSHRELFELTLSRLRDMGDWLEQGNDSPYKVWQKAEDEAQIRNLVAGWMNGFSSSRYTCAQENELANRQRPDIWTQNPYVSAPVPIELKLLDQGWSGPKLCERLRNQLAGDYLREVGAGSGVMLLVWQGQCKKSKWKIGDRLVNLQQLEAALNQYWVSIANNYPGVFAIEVLVIDLTAREMVSNSSL